MKIKWEIVNFSGKPLERKNKEVTDVTKFCFLATLWTDTN